MAKSQTLLVAQLKTWVFEWLVAKGLPRGTANKAIYYLTTRIVELKTSITPQFTQQALEYMRHASLDLVA